MLGFIETQAPATIRRAVLDLQSEILSEPYFAGVPRVTHTTGVAFHAKDDEPAVRYRFFKLLADLEFEAQIIVARKIERVFRTNFEAKEQAFYDHLVTRLFQNLLHRYSQNQIIFAKRGSRNRQAPLLAAIYNGIRAFEKQWNTQVTTQVSVAAQTPKGEPCLSVVDYVNWAVHRAYTTGEMRYFRLVQDKVALLVDLYDTQRYPESWYSRKNPFDIAEATPL